MVAASPQHREYYQQAINKIESEMNRFRWVGGLTRPTYGPLRCQRVGICL